MGISILSSLRLLRSEVEYLALILGTWRKELLLADVHDILILMNSKTIGFAQIRLAPLSMSRLFFIM